MRPLLEWKESRIHPSGRWFAEGIVLNSQDATCMRRTQRSHVEICLFITISIYMDKEPVTPAKPVPARPGNLEESAILDFEIDSGNALIETNDDSYERLPYPNNKEDQVFGGDKNKSKQLSSATPSSSEKPTSSKRRNNGADLNEKPQKRPKVKKHRPKVVVEGTQRKSPKPQNPKSSTPKPVTPKHATKAESTREKRRKHILKNFANSFNGQVAYINFEHSAKTVKRSLNFRLGNQPGDDNDREIVEHTESAKASISHKERKASLRVLTNSSNDPDVQGQPSSENFGISCWRDANSNLENQKNDAKFGKNDHQSQHQTMHINKASCMASNVSHPEDCNRPSNMSLVGRGDCVYQNNCWYTKQLLRVYRRTFQRDQCQKNSRKLGPNFPSIFKKSRTRRQKTTRPEALWSTVVAANCRKKVKSVTVKLSKSGIVKKLTLTRKQKVARNSEVNCNYVDSCNIKMRKKFARMILPTEKQIKAAVSDPKSFSCVLNLCPIVQAKEKRLKGLTRRPNYVALTDNFLIENQSRGVINDSELFKCMKALHPLVKFRKKRSKRFAKRHEIIESKASIDQLAENQNLVTGRERNIRSFLGCKANFLGKPLQDNVGAIQSSFWKEKNFVIHIRGYKLQHGGASRARQDEEVLHGIEDSDDAFLNLFDYVISKLNSLSISGICGHLVGRAQNDPGAIVPRGGRTVRVKKPKILAKVYLDPETLRIWKVLMESHGSDFNKAAEEGKEKWWSEQREVFCGRAELFISRMYLIQGDRRFSPWKGSVIDSVVGAFLTQNVSDHLSSSAFMSLAARFPLESTRNLEGCGDDGDISCSQELGGRNNVRDVSKNLGLLELENECTIQRGIAPRTEEEAGVIPCVSSSNCAVPHDFCLDTKVTTEKDLGAYNNYPQCKNKAIHQSEKTSIKKEGKVRRKLEEPIDWDGLRKAYSNDRVGETSFNSTDSINWDEVRRATVSEVADAIKERGMSTVLAQRIKECLDRVIKDHGRIDLEWLRNVPPDKAKDYLLSIQGLGLKSVECIRLLTLLHPTFPVDTNVGRVVVRLGWVPLQPLPEGVKLHDLEQYPMMDSIQKYLYPRLSNFDEKTLYELHCQLIAFGKVFCTKKQPNCNACPMRGECRHYASALASAQHALPRPQGKSVPISKFPDAYFQSPAVLSLSDEDSSRYRTEECEPIIEIPSSPGPECSKSLERDIEDFGNESDDEITVINLSKEDFREKVIDFKEKANLLLLEGDMSKALVAVTAEVASIPMPKLKNVSRLRTVHLVYELPDSHPLLANLDKRESDDPAPYLLAIWISGQTGNTFEQLKGQSDCKESEVCNKETCLSCQSSEERTSQTVCGTILIPCRTAARGRFPLNGTYFQVNEVFADDESSEHPIKVPREWIWNLPRRSLYCGAYASSIFKGLSTREIQYCFWKGFICVRGFNRRTRSPRQLAERFHVSTVVGKRKQKDDQ